MPRRTIRAGGGPTVYSFQDDWDPLANGMGYAFSTMLNAGNEAAQIREQRASNQAASERAASDDARQDRSLTLQEGFRRDQLDETTRNNGEQEAFRRDQLKETQTNRERQDAYQQQQLTMTGEFNLAQLGRQNANAARDERQHAETLALANKKYETDKTFGVMDRMGAVFKHFTGGGPRARAAGGGGTDQGEKLTQDEEQHLDKQAQEIVAMLDSEDPEFARLKQGAIARLLRRQGVNGSAPPGASRTPGASPLGDSGKTVIPNGRPTSGPSAGMELPGTMANDQAMPGASAAVQAPGINLAPEERALLDAQPPERQKKFLAIISNPNVTPEQIQRAIAALGQR